MRMNAGRTTKVVVDTTRPRRPTKQSPHIAQTLRAGACRGAGFVAVLAHGAYDVLRPASRNHPRQAARRARAGVLQRLPNAVIAARQFDDADQQRRASDLGMWVFL